MSGNFFRIGGDHAIGIALATRLVFPQQSSILMYVQPWLIKPLLTMTSAIARTFFVIDLLGEAIPTVPAHLRSEREPVPANDFEISAPLYREHWWLSR